MKKIQFKTPKVCPCCGAPWRGGSQIPGEPLPLGARVFYRCGASLSIKENIDGNALILLFKNCCCKSCEPIE